MQGIVTLQVLAASTTIRMSLPTMFEVLFPGYRDNPQCYIEYWYSCIQTAGRSISSALSQRFYLPPATIRHHASHHTIAPPARFPHPPTPIHDHRCPSP